MNKKDFKAGIKAELKNNGFTENKLNTIAYGDGGTVIFFMADVLQDSPLAVWLQNRFKWGVTIIKNSVKINAPNENNKLSEALVKHEQPQLDGVVVFIPEKAPEYCAVLDTKDRDMIYFGKDKMKAYRIATAINEHEALKKKEALHNELVDALRPFAEFAKEYFYKIQFSSLRVKEGEIYSVDFSGNGAKSITAEMLKKAEQLIKQAEQK